MRLKLSISCAIACCALAGMLLVVSPALAGQGRLFTGSFGGVSSTVPDPYPLGELSSVAVDASSGLSSGDVYVADPGNHRVEKFDAGGHFILMFGKDVNKSKVEEAGSSTAERDVCTAISGDVCQAGVASAEPGGFTGRLYIAVDNSGGMSTGDVYVGDITSFTEIGTGAVTKFDEEGHVISGWGSGGRLTASGTTPFGAVHGVSVDASGNLWVYGTRSRESGGNLFSGSLVFELKQDSTFVQGWPGGNESTGQDIAVDSEGNVDLGEDQGGGDNGVVKYSFTGEHLKRITPLEGERAKGFVLDPSTRSIYQGVSGAIVRYEPSCQDRGGFSGCLPAERFSSSHLKESIALAVNPSGPLDTIYAAQAVQDEIEMFSVETLPEVVTVPASGFTATSATLNGTVDPEGVALTECYFEWGEGTGSYEHTAACEAPDAAEVGAGNKPVAVHARVPIQSGKSYHFRLVAANANQLFEPTRGLDTVFGPPLVDSTSVLQVTGESVTFQAEIDPRNLNTEYHFEYLSETEFNENGQSFNGPHPAVSVPQPDVALGAGQQDLLATVHIRGLAPQTTYRYRVVAHSLLAEGAETVDGPAESFQTWGVGAFGLPDGRQWEMVSPPNKNGALIEPIGEDWVIQAAAGGGRLAYAARTATETNPQGTLIYQPVLATRADGGGWSSRDLSIPHMQSTSVSAGEGWEYRFFSEDLSRAMVQPFGAFVPCVSAQGEAQPCLSLHATEQTAFLDDLYTAGGGSGEACTTSCFTPLVTGAEGYADVPPHTTFGQFTPEGNTCPASLRCGPRFLYATPNASHVLLESHAALTPSPAAGKAIPVDSLYEWSEGAPAAERLRLVSVLPGNAKGEALPAGAPLLGIKQENIRHAISGDGTRVVWASAGHLYLRENATQPQSALGSSGECLEPADACTVQIDAGLSGNAAFQTADAEVTRIFFTQGEANIELYEYNVEKGARVKMTTGGEVLGSVIGASNDGSRIYFVGNGALAPHAVAGHCKTATDVPEEVDGCNLYEMHYDGTQWEPPTLIAVLSSSDVTDWSSVSTGYDWLAARVSSNGQWLAFMSLARLTGYDNQDAASNQPDQEVYEYNAQTGSLTCASCNPTGERPHGVPAAQIDAGNGGLAGGKGVPFFGSIAANLPPWTPNSAGGAIYQSRYLSDSGRLLFDSADALVPKDINGTEDVYEYEPEGVPAGEYACSSASQSGSVVFESARVVQIEGRSVQTGAGCVGLISSGESPKESAFLDASETGSEVFFITSAALAAQDIDTGIDVYDARECSSQSPCAPTPAAMPPPCTTEASCRPAPSPQPEIFGPSGSQTFSGPGNVAPTPAPAQVVNKAKPLTRAQKLARALVACHKDRGKLKRRKCETAAHKRYGTKGAKAGSGRLGANGVNHNRRGK